MLSSLVSNERNARSNALLGALLAFIAGAINAMGFLAVGYYTSHMTGIVSSIADYISLHNFHAALLSVLFLLSFVFGAITTTVLINFGRWKKLASAFAPPLLLEAFLLLLLGLDISRYTNQLGLPVTSIVMLLCFIMGLQNAIITKISNAVIRTTHVTGLVTDIGIELGRYVCHFLLRSKETPIHPDKLKLHLLIFSCFLGGGILAALSFKYFGFLIIVPLAVVLGGISMLPFIASARR